MFSSDFQFLRQLGADATAPTPEAPGSPTAPAVAPVADDAPTNTDSVPLHETISCAHATHLLVSVSRGATVKPYFYVACEERWFASQQSFVLPAEGGIFEVKVLSPRCFLRVTDVPAGDTAPVRICSANTSRYGK